jgi:dissimilatory sulfite reductase (desulfoviridin) alpha/beta subunit
MLHRAKRTPGQFMMRLRVPNGIVNADQMRFYADCVAKYGNENGVIDITTRANIVSIAELESSCFQCDLLSNAFYHWWFVATKRG